MRKMAQKKRLMNAISMRLEEDIREPLPDFLDKTGLSPTKVVNECIRQWLPEMEKRWLTGGVKLFGSVDIPKERKQLTQG